MIGNPCLSGGARPQFDSHDSTLRVYAYSIWGTIAPRIGIHHCLRVFRLDFMCQFAAHVYRFSEKTVQCTELKFFLVVGYIIAEICGKSFRSYDICENRYFCVKFCLIFFPANVTKILLDLMLQELSLYSLPFSRKTQI